MLSSVNVGEHLNSPIVEIPDPLEGTGGDVEDVADVAEDKEVGAPLEAPDVDLEFGTVEAVAEREEADTDPVDDAD
jgi:hypothetical protein